MNIWLLAIIDLNITSFLVVVIANQLIKERKFLEKKSVRN
jgi:hypothetical protein